MFFKTHGPPKTCCVFWWTMCPSHVIHKMVFQKTKKAFKIRDCAPPQQIYGERPKVTLADIEMRALERAHQTLMMEQAKSRLEMLKAHQAEASRISIASALKRSANLIGLKRKIVVLI
jgi:hypothetical protein